MTTDQVTWTEAVKMYVTRVSRSILENGAAG